MNNIAIAKDADDLADRISFTNIGEEFISKSRPFGCTFDNSGDIYKRERGRKNLFGAKNLSKLGKALIRHANDAHVGFDSGKGIVRGQDIVLSKRIKKGRLSNVR